MLFSLYPYRNEKEIISIIKFRQAAAKTQNAMMDPSHRSKSESTQILVEQSAFENPAYHQEEDVSVNDVSITKYTNYLCGFCVVAS